MLKKLLFLAFMAAVNIAMSSDGSGLDDENLSTKRLLNQFHKLGEQIRKNDDEILKFGSEISKLNHSLQESANGTDESSKKLAKIEQDINSLSNDLKNIKEQNIETQKSLDDKLNPLGASENNIDVSNTERLGASNNLKEIIFFSGIVSIIVFIVYKYFKGNKNKETEES